MHLRFFYRHDTKLKFVLKASLQELPVTPLLDRHGLLAEKYLYRATPAVTWDLDLRIVF
jgi:hypothetical protein